jgi:hypothetical protein
MVDKEHKEMNNDGTKPAVPPPENWRTLAQQASTEADPNKLVEIVEHLCEIIDQKKPKQQSQLSGPAK